MKILSPDTFVAYFKYSTTSTKQKHKDLILSTLDELGLALGETKSVVLYKDGWCKVRRTDEGFVVLDLEAEHLASQAKEKERTEQRYLAFTALLKEKGFCRTGVSTSGEDIWSNGTDVISIRPWNLSRCKSSRMYTTVSRYVLDHKSSYIDRRISALLGKDYYFLCCTSSLTPERAFKQLGII